MYEQTNQALLWNRSLSCTPPYPSPPKKTPQQNKNKIKNKSKSQNKKTKTFLLFKLMTKSQSLFVTQHLKPWIVFRVKILNPHLITLKNIQKQISLNSIVICMSKEEKIIEVISPTPQCTDGLHLVSQALSPSLSYQTPPTGNNKLMI